MVQIENDMQHCTPCCFEINILLLLHVEGLITVTIVSYAKGHRQNKKPIG